MSCFPGLQWLLTLSSCLLPPASTNARCLSCLWLLPAWLPPQQGSEAGGPLTSLCFHHSRPVTLSLSGAESRFREKTRGHSAATLESQACLAGRFTYTFGPDLSRVGLACACGMLRSIPGPQPYLHVAHHSPARCDPHNVRRRCRSPWGGTPGGPLS